MIDQYKKIAPVYQQTPTKKLTLIPAIKRDIPKKLNKINKHLLDIGCGTGDFYEILKKYQYKYFGFDNSKEMIKTAKQKYPSENFKLLSATNFSKKYKLKFDTILVNLVLHTFSEIKIKKTLSEIKKVSDNNTYIIVGVPHPNFDHYMRKGLFKKKNVKTSFDGYFVNEADYILNYKFNNKQVRFMAKHRTLESYFKIFTSCGFLVTDVDECKPNRKSTIVSKDKLYKKRLYPTYIIFTLHLSYPTTVINKK